MRPDAAIRGVTARPYTIPTDAPEADGTYAWRETTLVVATIEAGGHTGLGYTYSSSVAASLMLGNGSCAIEQFAVSNMAKNTTALSRCRI